MITLWALVDNDDICTAVHSASEEWVAGWIDPEGLLRYIPTAEGTGYAGPGFTYDEPTGWFIPPAKHYPEGWVFNRDPDVWEWQPPDTP